MTERDRPHREGLLDDGATDRLRTALLRADYRVAAVVERVGEDAHRALGRNQTLPALRALGDDRDPLATLTRLWPLAAGVPRADADVALPGLVEPLAGAGVLTLDGEQVRATVDIRPYASSASDTGADVDAWVVSDPTPGLDGRVERIRPDYVLGVSSASTSLAQLTVRRPVDRALDLGTGCGVQSLHLAAHCAQVVATDVNERALQHADLTCRLSGVQVDLRDGSLYDPVAGESFDLIVTNPPYVISPPGTTRLVYRETAAAGDGLVERVVRDGIPRLAPGGTLQVLANWVHPRGGDGAERLRGWVRGTGCDLHVVQREVLDPYEYVELWLADAGLTGDPAYAERYDAWLAYLDGLGVAGIGMGWITVRRSERDDPDLSVEEWAYPVEQPIAPALAARQDAVGLLAGLDDAALLARCWVLADDVVQETEGVPGAGDPEHTVLRQRRGFRRAIAVDAALGGVLGACDGELPLGRLVGAVASLLDADPGGLAVDLMPRLREAIRDGFLRPAQE